MTNEEYEELVVEKKLSGRRVTPDGIAAKIIAVAYFTGEEAVRGSSDSRVYLADNSAMKGVYTSYSIIEEGNLDVAQVSRQLLTFCIITVQNGFTFVGKSACADPMNFNAEIGRRLAYEDAYRQVMSHEGYLLKENIYNETKVSVSKEEKSEQ